MNKLTTAMLAVGIAAATDWSGEHNGFPPGFQLTEPPTPGRKCLLPDCTRFTTHNGGYCCAEHCRKNKK